MPRTSSDETQSDPLKLLARYRELCELSGGYRAINAPIPREIRQQVGDLEGELQTRLWLANNDGSDSVAPRAGAGSRKSSRSDPLPSVSRMPEANVSQTPPDSALVYSDGACVGNPGPGGYGTIVRLPGVPEKTISGGKSRTTNNEMELTAAIEGLKFATSAGARDISVFSDSEYLVKGMNDWMKGWLRNGWKTRTGHPVKNRELWEELYKLSQGRNIAWNWVAGHAGHPENELCDRLAVAAAKKAAGR